jgi:hypothetical protein
LTRKKQDFEYAVDCVIFDEDGNETDWLVADSRKLTQANIDAFLSDGETLVVEGPAK